MSDQTQETAPSPKSAPHSFSPTGPKSTIRSFFKNYAQFKGYSNRGEFWWPWLTLVFIHLGLAAITTILVATAFSDGIMTETYDPAGSPEYYQRIWFEGTANVIVNIALLLHFLIWVATISPLMAVTWRRFHDTGLPGPVFFLWFIPIIGWIIVLILLARGSKPEKRRPVWDAPTTL
ncbi:hypothetical protein BG28_09205 [Nesterenkonia sp. AN1]|uniref:DUF805 domain-containing protein n=1 Tax=Nesterenkonia sp. AN1 TaxID=652017 RepID=UPI00044E3505|nr:DUF805 domain-containing protein [Nesterenkonia sp. AN1]EXF23916.1 hypothetical protein BG28_09205 [Nesterenkonia sp. AN1]